MRRSESGILRRVRAQNRAEDAELNPARVQLRIDRARHVPADVVAPVGVAHVGRRRRKPRLKRERIPHRNRVARKSNLVAVIPQPAPAMKQQRPLALALLIGKVHVVQPPRRIHAGQIRRRLLLPVEPPEVHALFLQRMQHQVQVIRRPLLVRRIERNVFLRRRIDPHRARHRRIRLLPRLNPRRRMQIHRRLQPILMQLFQKRIGIGKQHLVPRVAGPSQHLTRLIDRAHGSELLIAHVPVHVDHQHIQRRVVLAEVRAPARRTARRYTPSTATTTRRTRTAAAAESARPRAQNRPAPVCSRVHSRRSTSRYTSRASHSPAAPSPTATRSFRPQETGSPPNRTAAASSRPPAPIPRATPAPARSAPRVFDPRAVSSVRVVPCRFSESAIARMPHHLLAVDGERDREIAAA